MEHLSFVLWLVLYPISVSICSYISTKERKINNKEPYSSDVRAISQLIEVLIWVFVAKLLF